MEENSKRIIVAVLVIGFLAVMSPEGLQLTGSSVNDGCYIQRYFGECYELGENWEEDPDNIGWCRNCGYIGYE